MTDVVSTVNEMASGFENLDAGTKAALKTASNIASSSITMISGIQTLARAAGESIRAVEKASIILTIISAGVAIISTIVNLFNQSQKAEAQSRKRLIQIKEAQKQQQLEYNTLLREQNQLLKEASSIFGNKEIEKATGYIQRYQEALQEYYKVLKGDAPQSPDGVFGRIFQDEYEKQNQAYTNGIGALFNARVVTGSKTVSSGFLGLGKSQKDVYSSLLDVYPDLLDAENRLNVARADSILSTQKMSDADKQLLENLVELEKEMQEAEKALESYLDTTFGSLGDDLMNSITEAIQSGSNAWEEFGKSGRKVLEDLGKQLTYSLFFAKEFENLEKELKDIYSQDASTNEAKEKVANDAASLIADFYSGIEGQMEAAQLYTQQWNQQLDATFGEVTKERQATQKGFTAMSQDSADELNGRFTALQGLTYEISNGVKILSSNSNRILEYLSLIESNTQYCKKLDNMQTDIHAVKTGIDTITTKGITIK